MRPRHAVPLTPSEWALPICLPSCQQIASVTTLETSLMRHSQITENPATLSLAKSALTSLPPASSLESALTKTLGVEGLFLPFWNSSVAGNHSLTPISFHTLTNTPFSISSLLIFMHRTGGAFRSPDVSTFRLVDVQRRIPFPFRFLRTLLHATKTRLYSFHSFPHSLCKTPGGGVRGDGTQFSSSGAPEAIRMDILPPLRNQSVPEDGQ
jgi:hypothetical protein